MKINFDTLFCSSSEAALRSVFSWLTRIGAAPAFGSRPIGWYQSHQCHAIDILKEHAADNNEAKIRCKAGVIERRTSQGWSRVTTPSALFSAADLRARR